MGETRNGQAVGDSGLVGSAGSFGWAGTDESIERGTSPDRILFKVDGTTRAEVRAALVALLNGAEVIESRVTDGATAKAMTHRWKSGVATPTSGAIFDQWVWENNVAAEQKAMVLSQNTVGVRLGLYSGGTAKLLLESWAGNQLLDFVDSGAAIRCGAGVGDLYAILNSLRMRVTPGDLGCLSFPLTNKTGGVLAAGDVCRLDTATDSAVRANSAAGQVGGLVVVTGGADNATVFCALVGVVQVLCTTGAVARGDVLQLSATAKQAETAAVPVLNGSIGYAVAAKGAGATGLVKAVVLPSI